MCSPNNQQPRPDSSAQRGPTNPPAQHAPTTPSASASASASPTAPTRRRSVAFSTVTVRHYPLTLGTANPYSTLSSSSIATRSIGAPLTLSWEYQELDEQTLANYEEEGGYNSLAARGEEGGDRPRKSTRQMKLSAGRRRAILELRNDVTRDMIDEAENEAKRCEERKRRYLARCQGERTTAGGSAVPRRSSKQSALSVRHRPSYPSTDSPLAALASLDDSFSASTSHSGGSYSRKACDATCISLFRRQAFPSIAPATATPRMQMGQQPRLQLPSSSSWPIKGATTIAAATLPKTRRMVSSRAA